MTGRAKLDKAGEQVAVCFLGLRDAVMDHGGVTAPAAKLWQRGSVRQQANPILHVEKADPRRYVTDMGNAKIQS